MIVDSPSPIAVPCGRSLRRTVASCALAALALAAASGRGLAQPHAHAMPPVAAKSPALDDTARVRRWREDLADITKRVREQHPRPFALCPEARFDSAVHAIERRISTTDDARLAVECMRMVAALGDAHTQLVGTLPQLGFTAVLPIWLRPFEDGVYLLAADPAYASVVGAKVTRIGNVPAEEALARVGSAMSADNRYCALDRVPFFLMLPAMLQALDISPDRDRVSLEIERTAGKRERIEIAGGAPPAGFPFAFFETEFALPAEWKSARSATGAALPRCDRRVDENWWFEALPESKTLYLRIRRVDPLSGDLAYFEMYRRLFAAVDSMKPRALIVDLRHDHGGNNTILDPLIRGIVERPWLNRPSSLFALIDRGTFSAAMNAAVFLDDQTRATFAGEPTGGRVNHYGDAPERETPNHKMILQVSTVAWNSRFPNDDRPWIAPELAVPSRFADWRDARDPVLDAALGAVGERSLGPRVLAAALRSGAKAGQAELEAWEVAHPSPWESQPPAELGVYCADLMDRGEWANAVAIGEVMVALDPRSAISWRLLGEAQAARGDHAHAIESFKKTLEINPRAQVAAMMLKRLGGSR